MITKRVFIGIFGKRNQGKSSLINALAGQDIAVVSEIAGTTKEPERKSIEVFGIGPVVFVDTAGIDDSGEIGNIGLKKTFDTLNTINVAVLLIAENQFGNEEVNLIERLKNYNIPFIIVHNKADKQPLKEELKEILSKYKSPIVECNTIDKKGISELIDKIVMITPPSAFILKRELPAERTKQLLETLESRFNSNMVRHKGISWAEILGLLVGNSDKLWSINEMEKTGGEPDLVSLKTKAKGYLYIDCSGESPVGRRSICYDRNGLDSRKDFKPEQNAVEMAAQMGIEILDEEQYREFQTTGIYDTKTSSWIKTPPEIRELGGALFADRRYNRVFIYHNGASSYYGARAFRGFIEL